MQPDVNLRYIPFTFLPIRAVALSMLRHGAMVAVLFLLIARVKYMVFKNKTKLHTISTYDYTGSFRPLGPCPYIIDPPRATATGSHDTP